MKTVIIVLLVLYIIHMHDVFKRALEEHNKKSKSPLTDYDHTNKEDVFKRIRSKINLYNDVEIAGYHTAFDNPESKERVIFHGGCIDCSSPAEIGIDHCIGCQYFTADWKLPDLSIKANRNES